MSKRNFILLIILVVLLVASVLGFLYFRNKPTTGPEGTTEGTNFISQFNPFGTNKPTPTDTTTGDNETNYQPNPEEEAPKMQLTKISTMPIAGFTVFNKERFKELPPVVDTASTPSETSVDTAPATKAKVITKPTTPPTEFIPALRYVERSTGNIYQTFADHIAEQKFSSTIIPKVYDAYFGNHGESVVMRYLKEDARTIETFVGNLPKEILGVANTGTNEVKGAFLPDNVKDISLSPDNSKIFYLFDSNNSQVGVTLNLLNNKKVQIFDSPFTEWLSQWSSSNTITLSTKPSANVPGYMYTMDAAGKNFSQTFGNIAGLTTLESPNGKLVLYSDKNLSLNVYHTDTRNVDILGIKTLSEKCVWGKASEAIYCAVPKSIVTGDYPDTWYQGEVSFSDQILKRIG